MGYCRSFIDAYPWGDLFERFLLSPYALVYLFVLLLATIAAVKDDGAMSWGLGIGFVAVLALLAILQFEDAQDMAYIRTGQHGVYCHSDIIDQRVRDILQNPANRYIFFIQLFLNALFTSVVFWLPFIAVRKLRRCSDRNFQVTVE